MVGDGWRWLGMVGSVSWDPLGGTDAARTREIETLADPGRPLACQRIPKRVPKSAPKGSLKGFQKGPPGGLQNHFFLSRCQNASIQRVREQFCFCLSFWGVPRGSFWVPFGALQGGALGPRGCPFGDPRGSPGGSQKELQSPPLGTTQNYTQQKTVPKPVV